MSRNVQKRSTGFADNRIVFFKFILDIFNFICRFGYCLLQKKRSRLRPFLNMNDITDVLLSDKVRKYHYTGDHFLKPFLQSVLSYKMIQGKELLRNDLRM